MPKRLPGARLGFVFLAALAGAWLSSAEARGQATPAGATATDEPLPSHASAHRVTYSPRIDGNLEEWDLSLFGHDQITLRSDRQVNRYPRNSLGTKWGGPDDLSAVFYVAYDARALYLAGRIKDNALVHGNNIDWWLGDAVELFLDVEPGERRVGRAPPAPYDASDYQIFLMPLNPEVPFGVYKPKLGEASFTGVRVAATRRADGYDLEAAIPWHNFPRVRVGAGCELGFDIALDDVDEAGATETKTYMVWNGQLAPSEFPDRFGTLTLLPPPEDQEGGTAGSENEKPILDFLVIMILISGFVAAPFAANVLLRRVSRHAMRRKVMAFAVFALLFLLTWVLPAAIRAALDRSKQRELESRLAPIGTVLDEIRRVELLDPSSDGYRDDIERLLRGDEVRYQESFTFREIPITPAPPVLWTEQGIPYEDSGKGILVAEAGRSSFLLEEGGEVAERVYVICSLEPRDGYLRPPPESRRKGRIGSLRLNFQNGKTVSVDLERDVNVDYSLQERPYSHSSQWSSKALLARMTTVPAPSWSVSGPDLPAREWCDHSHQIAIDVPVDLLDTPLVSVEYQHESPEDALRVFGIATSLSRRNPQLEVVPLRRLSLTGVPIRIFDDVPRSATVSPKKGDERGTVIPVNAPADRIWFVYSALNAYPAAAGAAKFETIGSIVVTSRGARELQHEVPLVTGENVDDRRAAPEGKHPSGMKSRVAQCWRDLDGTLVHDDILEYTPINPGPIADIAVRDSGGSSSVQLSAVTLGTINPGRRKALGDLTTIEPLGDAEGKVALTSAARSGLRGLDVRVVNESTLAGALAAPPSIRWEESGRDRALKAFLPVDPDRAPGTFLEVSDRSPGPPPSEAPFTVAKILLLTLLLPLGLVLVTDVLDRTPRLRVKLVVTFGLVSVVPLIVFFFVLSQMIGRHVEENLSSKLDSLVSDARNGLDTARRRAQAEAETILRDPRIIELLANQLPPEEKRKALESRLGEARRERLLDQPSSYVILRDHARTAEGARFVETTYRSEPPPCGYIGLKAADSVTRSDVLASDGELMLFGFATTEGRSANRFQEILAALPLDDDSLRVLQRTLKGVEISLLTPNGETVASTLGRPPEASEERLRRDREAIRQALTSGAPPRLVVENPGGEYLAAYDLIRDGGGRTAAAVSLSVPRADLITLQNQIGRWFAILGSVVFLLVIVVGSLMTEKITVPIEKLERISAEIARGNLQCDVPEGGPDEVGSLTRAFNAMTAELRGRIQQLHELNRGIQALNETLDRDSIVSAAATALARASEADGVVFILEDPNRDAPHVIGGIDRGESLRPFDVPRSAGFVAEALQATAPLMLGNLRQTERYRRAHPDEQRLLKPYGSALALPLVSAGATRGTVLLLFQAPAIGPLARNLEFLSTLVSQATIALENARLYQLAVQDPATGLYVHSYFEGRLKEEIDRAQRAGRPLSVIRLDIDNFASYREAVGPESAVEALRDAARTLRGALRRMYVAARSHEASLEILLPETEKREAARVAERLRRQVESRLRSAAPLASAPDAPRLAVSVGASSFPEDAASLEFLLNEAAIALQKSRVSSRSKPARAEEEKRPAEASLLTDTELPFRSDKSIAMLETANRIAQSNVTVLLQGETGVGKEVIAEFIHRRSPRRDSPLIRVNCSAFPETLLESELFGHEKGAFTGADSKKIGRFEQANGGTLFLDEIGDVSLAVQVKLLRVLQDRTFDRLGSNTPITLDVRIVAATNKDLVRAIQSGAFREDLYYRLNVVSILVPPLRERKEEIPSLVDFFIRQWNESNAKTIRGIAPEALDMLYHHGWPGNIRELKNCIERGMVITSGPMIRPEDIQIGPPSREASSDERAQSVEMTASPATTRSKSGEAFAFPPARRVAATGPESPRDDLNSRQMELLRILHERPEITTAEYMALLRISKRTGLRDLSDLVDRQLLTRLGRTKGAVYRLKAGAGG